MTRFHCFADRMHGTTNNMRFYIRLIHLSVGNDHPWTSRSVTHVLYGTEHLHNNSLGTTKQSNGFTMPSCSNLIHRPGKTGNRITEVLLAIANPALVSFFARGVYVRECLWKMTRKHQMLSTAVNVYQSRRLHQLQILTWALLAIQILKVLPRFLQFCTATSSVLQYCQKTKLNCKNQWLVTRSSILIQWYQVGCVSVWITKHVKISPQKTCPPIPLLRLLLQGFGRDLL